MYVLMYVYKMCVPKFYLQLYINICECLHTINSCVCWCVCWSVCLSVGWLLMGEFILKLLTTP